MSAVTTTQDSTLPPEVAMAAPHARSSHRQDSGQPARTVGTGSARDTDSDSADRTIADMRGEIDDIDAELVRLIQRRSEISHAIGAARASEGGTRIVYSREIKILDRFAVLGPAGTELGMLLLSLGRGQLGRK